MSDVYSTGFIDPPGDFAPLDEWKAFVGDLEAMEGRSQQAEDALKEAKAHVAALEGDDDRDEDFADLEA